jgi:biopolymer transport protein ExbD
MMMLLTRRKRQPNPGQLNMASMIDVVFLLLIFFMCTMSFAAPEKDILTQLPRLATGTGGLERDFEPIRIRVSAAGASVLVTLDGAPVASFDELVRGLSARRQIADLPVIIDGQSDVAFKYMVAALDSCYEAELTRIAFSPRGAAD